MRLRTALYGRTSKDDPRRVTIEIQQQTLRDWSLRDPLVTVVDEYWDDGVTGKTPIWDRPEGKRLLEDVKSGRVESVAVAYADRFGRTLLDGLQAVKSLENHGVKLVAVNDGWDARRNDSPLYFQFRMMMAEEEHRRITQRMRDGKLRAMERDGAPPGGPLVFGYRMNERGHFVPDPIEAPVVIRIFEMALEGESNNRILAWVKTAGAHPGRKFQKRIAGSVPAVCVHQQKAQWHLTKIGKILRNRVYLGERTWGGRTFSCVPLVDQETFDQVQATHAIHARCGARKGDGSKGILTGLLKCGVCGGTYYHKPMGIRRPSGKMDYYAIYMCDKARRDWSNSCKSKIVRVDQLDADVWAIVERYLEDPEALVRKVLAADESLSGAAADLEMERAKCAAALESLEAEAGAIWEQQRENGWPLAWVTPRLNDLHIRREQSTFRLQEVQRKLATLSISREQSASITAALASVRARVKKRLTVKDKYQIVRLVVAGGVIKTAGSGRGKQAHITIQLKWGEQVTEPSPKLPKDWCYGSQGYIPVVVHQALRTS